MSKESRPTRFQQTRSTRFSSAELSLLFSQPPTPGKYTLLYLPCGYVPPQRVWFLRRLGVKGE